MTKTTKAKNKDKADKSTNSESNATNEEISTSAELKSYLINVRDKLEDQSAAAIFAMSALNRVMNSTKIYPLLDNENKEIARDIWFRLKRAGLQLRNPPLLFTSEESISL